MKLIDLLGPMDPKTVVNVFIDVEKDKYENDNTCLYEGIAGSVPALLTKIKVTHVGLSYDLKDIKDNPPVITVEGIFTTADDSNQYKALIA